MNPTSNSPSSGETPVPTTNYEVSTPVSGEQPIAASSSAGSPERLSRTDTVSSQAPAAQSQGRQLPAVQPQVQARPTPTSNPIQNGVSPAIADDVDVIEKEWVDKAKDIVTATKDDPYHQEEEVEKLKADYLKKRYGKDIKSSSSV